MQEKARGSEATDAFVRLQRRYGLDGAHGQNPSDYVDDEETGEDESVPSGIGLPPNRDDEKRISDPLARVDHKADRAKEGGGKHQQPLKDRRVVRVYSPQRNYPCDGTKYQAEHDCTRDPSRSRQRAI